MSTTVIDKARKNIADPGPAPKPDRRLVFISHANPQDNPAAAWFATQLTLLGYEVWCDLKNTHGSESEFWLKVQKTIENDAAKFVYILSNTSCDLDTKRGLYKELQTADNLRIDNFIVPLRIEKLTRSLPILIGTGLYINAENWAAGLMDLVDRLNEDGVPRRAAIDFEKIASWWPAISAESVVRQQDKEELVSNILGITALPETIHFIKVLSERNPIAGYERLQKVLPANPAHYAHGDFAITFAGPFDLKELTRGYEFETAYALKTREFMASGHEESGIAPDIAKNIVTYLVGQAWDSFLAARNLSEKRVGRSKRAVWYPRDGLLAGNKASVAEPSKKAVPIQLVGSVKHYRKTYRWHFGVFPTVDLRVHGGIILSPKAVISLRYDGKAGECPVPIDDKKVLKSLNWWNKEWRQKLLAMLSWLSDGKPEIVIAAGYQQIVIAAEPESPGAQASFKEMSDDEVINHTLRAVSAHAHSS